MLDPSIRGGLLAAGDASVDPRLLTSALLAAAAMAGADIIRQPAAEILSAGGRAAGARLADGTRVLARLGGPRRGLELSLDRRAAGRGGSAGPAGQGPDPAAAASASGCPPGLLARAVRGIVRGSSVYLVPRESGELVIGATQEELGADTRVTAGGVWELLRDARTIVPGITELELAEAVAGLRPGHSGQRAGARPVRAARAGAGHRPFPGRGAAGPGDRRRHHRLPGDAAAAGAWRGASRRTASAAPGRRSRRGRPAGTAGEAPGHEGHH